MIAMNIGVMWGEDEPFLSGGFWMDTVVIDGTPMALVQVHRRVELVPVTELRFDGPDAYEWEKFAQRVIRPLNEAKRPRRRRTAAA